MFDLHTIKNLKVDIDRIESILTLEKNVSLSMVRIDKIHPEISGNKLFKLYYYLEKAIKQRKKIITFGGPYSNHLVAAGSACHAAGIKCTGIVRGEKPKQLSHTLLLCKDLGMQLEFISRESYRRKDEPDFKNELLNKFGDHILVPEGGFGEEGVSGAALISNFYKAEDPTHICCAAGTATTLAGLIKSSAPEQHIIGFSAIKNMADFENRIRILLGHPFYKNYYLTDAYHFGGYAKKTGELILFMNHFYGQFKIPTDFVYTAKMMFGVFDLIKKNFFAPGSKIICIHTGGLQGNLSLPKETLNF